MTSLTLRDLNRATLARQLLLAREKLTTEQAVSRLVALQAQLPRPPFLGLWTRLNGFDRTALHRALIERRIVRVTSLRGTLHLMTAADYLALRASLQPALDKGLEAILRERLSSFDRAAVTKATRAFLTKTPATFDDVRTHLAAKFPRSDQRAMAYAMRLTLPLVQVPAERPWSFEAAAGFALADEWLGRPIPMGSAPADALVLRYLAAFGPATPADAQAWSALGGLRETFERLRPTLVTFRDERKRELFDLPDAPRPAAETPAPVRFLPEFDNLVLAHQDRTRVLADEYRSRVTTKNLQVRATFLVDGFVAGTWKCERKKQVATITLEPFATLTKKVLGALQEEGDAVLQFLEPDAKDRVTVAI